VEYSKRLRTGDNIGTRVLYRKFKREQTRREVLAPLISVRQACKWVIIRKWGTRRKGRQGRKRGTRMKSGREKSLPCVNWAPYTQQRRPRSNVEKSAG